MGCEAGTFVDIDLRDGFADWLVCGDVIDVDGGCAHSRVICT